MGQQREEIGDREAGEADLGRRGFADVQEFLEKKQKEEPCREVQIGEATDCEASRSAIIREHDLRRSSERLCATLHEPLYAFSLYGLRNSLPLSPSLYEITNKPCVMTGLAFRSVR